MERGCTILRFQNSTSLVLFLFYLAFNSYFFQLPLTLLTQWFFINFWLWTFYFNWCSIEPLWLWKRKIMEQLKPYIYDFGFLKLWYSPVLERMSEQYSFMEKLVDSSLWIKQPLFSLSSTLAFSSTHGSNRMKARHCLEKEQQFLNFLNLGL